MVKSLAGIATLLGTIIGAGILGIPYVVMKSGFLLGALNILILAVMMAIICLCIGEITLRTKSDHQLTGYAEKYLGKRGKILMFIIAAFGVISALLAYLVGESESISYLIFNSSTYKLEMGLFFWVLLSILSHKGIKTLKLGEEIGLTLVLIFLISIGIFSLNNISTENLIYNNPKNIFAPFGVVLFSLLSFSAIPALKRILDKNKSSLKGSIIKSYTFVTIIYLLFTAIVLGLKGSNTPQIATLALGKPFILLGMLTMFMAYLSLSNALRDAFTLDFGLSLNKAWFITSIVPLALFIFLQITNNANFIRIMEIGGTICATLATIMIFIIFHKAKYLGDRRPEYQIKLPKIIIFLIVTLFIIGAIANLMTI